VRGFTEALDVELSPLDIKVTSLAPWFVETPILDMGQTEDANHRMRDDLSKQETEIYPVSMAAQGAWEAAHGKKQHYGVGKLSNRTRFISRYLPKMLRKQLDKSLPDRN